MSGEPQVIVCTVGCCPGCQGCYGYSIGCHQDPCRCGLPCTCDYTREDEEPATWRDGCERHDSTPDTRHQWEEGDLVDGEAMLPYFDGDPCPMCGERYACGYDAEGRPLVHVLLLDEEGRSNL